MVNSKRERPKWITLDAFGTLFKFDHVLKEASEKIVDREHLDIDPETFYLKWKEISQAQEREKKPYKKLAEWFALSLTETFSFFDHKGRVEKGVNINLGLLQKVSLYPDAQTFLDQVHGKVKICLLTNIDNQELHKVLFQNQLQFDGIVTSEMLELYKPNPKIFEKALGFIETQPEEVVHIGDSPYCDIWGAKQVGMQAIWINRKEALFPQDLSVQPDRTFQNLEQAIPFFVD